jgi:hypothetical protein
MEVDIDKYDTFVCHNSDDKPEVKKVCSVLEEVGVTPWIDEKDIPPGKSWYEYIFNNIDNFSSALVFVGNNGTGPVQEEELEAMLRKFQEKGKPIIPVLLPSYNAREAGVSDFVRHQVIGKRDLVELKGDREVAVRNIIAGLLELPPREVSEVMDGGVDLSPVDRLPNYDRFDQNRLKFIVSWALLHAVGFAGVNLFVGASIGNPVSSLGILFITFAILALLLYTGWRQMSYLSITPDIVGGITGSIVGVALSFMVVQYTQNLGFFSSFAGVATTVGTACLVGVAAGWLMGSLFALIGAFGAFVAAILVPWFNAAGGLAVQGINEVPLIIFLSGGAGMWGVVLSMFLSRIFRDHEYFRSLTPGNS